MPVLSVWLPGLRCGVQAGVVKMNVDTDTQWAYWEGIKNFYQVGEQLYVGNDGLDNVLYIPGNVESTT